MNVRFWPKADIRTESKSVLLNGCFGEKSGRSSSGVVSVAVMAKGGLPGIRADV